jgi:hypothetical protein
MCSPTVYTGVPGVTRVWHLFSSDNPGSYNLYTFNLYILYLYIPSIHLVKMLSRTARPAVLMAKSMQNQTMGMATLKEIEQRLKSVRNIEKITKVS